MLRCLQHLREFEHKLVAGYYHTSNHQFITDDIIQLSMIYVFILEEFDAQPLPLSHIIQGINNNIVECKCDEINDHAAIFGRNTISFSNKANNNYYHWKFMILNVMELGNFSIGIVKNSTASVPSKQNLFQISSKGSRRNRTIPCSYGFIGKISMLKENTQYIARSSTEFTKKYDTLDMYLDLNKATLTFIINNMDHTLICNGIHTNIDYKMAVSLQGTGSCLELLSYHHSKFYDIENNKSLFNYIGFSRSISIFDEKITYLKSALAACPSMNELHNDYIDCLAVERRYMQAYQYILKHNIKEMLNMNCVMQIGQHFYLENEYKMAIKMYDFIKDDDFIIAYDLYFSIAFCYDEMKQYVQAVKYYNLYLKHNTEFVAAATNNLGLIFYHALDEFENALNCFLKLGENGIKQRDLEYKIAFCYKSCKKYEQALVYYKRNQNKHPHNPQNWTFVAMTYDKMGNTDKATECFSRSLEFDESKMNHFIYYQYARFLQSVQDFENARIYVGKSLKIAEDNDEKGMCYRTLGMIWESLGDIYQAIECSKKSDVVAPNNGDTLNNLGYYYLLTQQYELSCVCLKKSLEIGGNTSLTNGNIANCLCAMDRYDEAVPYLKESLSRESDVNHPDVGPKCLENYAKILFMKRDYAQSVKMCKELIEGDTFPEYKGKDYIYFLLSQNLENVYDLDGCLEYVKMAIAINPDNQEYQKLFERIKQ